MQKFVSIVIVGILIAFMGACASQPELTPINLSKTTGGDTLWSSDYAPISIRIDKSFKFVAQQNKSDQRVRRQYHVWERSSGEILYVIDINVKSQWKFPEDYDPTLGKDQKPNPKGMLDHKAMEYTVWDNIHPKSSKVLTDMGLKVPKCIAAVQRGEVSSSRKSAVFFVFVQEQPCGEFGSIMDDERNLLSFQ